MCGEHKNRSNFYKDSHKKEGIRSSCKLCSNASTLRGYHKHKEKINKRRKILRDMDIENVRLRRRESAKRNPETSKRYRIKNKEILKEKRRIYTKERKSRDIPFRLSCILRTRIGHIVRNDAKKGSAVRDLGCSVKELREYLELQFYNHPITKEEMTWDNWSKNGWHIDHILPLSGFDLSKREEFLVACNFTNLQPSWAEENYKKGGV